MKKLLLLISVVMVFLSASAKEPKKPSYFATHDPSPDSVMVDVSLNVRDGFYFLEVVDSVKGLSADDLFGKLKEYIGKTYKFPDAVIKTENKPNLIVFEGVLASVTSTPIVGRVEVKVKDGRFKWTVSNMTLMRNPIERVPKYAADRGERGQKWLKADLFPFLKAFREFMSSKEDDNW